MRGSPGFLIPNTCRAVTLHDPARVVQAQLHPSPIERLLRGSRTEVRSAGGCDGTGVGCGHDVAPIPTTCDADKLRRGARCDGEPRRTEVLRIGPPEESVAGDGDLWCVLICHVHANFVNLTDPWQHLLTGQYRENIPRDVSTFVPPPLLPVLR